MHRTRMRFLAGLLIGLTGCGGEPAATAAGGVQRKPIDKREIRAVTMIDIVAGDRRWTAQIDDTPTSRDFLAQLPLQVTLEDYASTEKVVTLPRRLTRDGAPAAVTPRAGQIGYYAPWGNIAIYYKDGPYSPGLIVLGRMTGIFDDLAKPGAVNVTIRRADRAPAGAPPGN